jgi:molybdopterin-containing oxidoreductase family membrane subunit
MRTSPVVIFIVSALVTVGMWFERFVIIVTSLHRAFLPGEWHMFHPTLVDIMIFVGSFGVFVTLFLLFLRFLPVFAMAELKAVLPQASPHPEEHASHEVPSHASLSMKGGH